LPIPLPPPSRMRPPRPSSASMRSSAGGNSR
jgi:hypothetical protein